MKRLILPLKKKWFDMIKSGEKKEEYREINHYWIKRLIDPTGWWADGEIPKNYVESKEFRYSLDFNPFKDFDEIEFTLGYPKKDDASRRILFKNPKICVTTGLRDWGAEPNKLYFVITWEEWNGKPAK